jgi:prepilin-type N-terminal cleavage/methylation domain-containing protein
MKTPYANKPAFTIVELLIVIVVIGILATISIVAYTGIQQNARNAQVISGVNAYYKAFLQYAATHSAYPSGLGCLGANYPSDQCWVGESGNRSVNSSIDAALAEYIGSKPTLATSLFSIGIGNNMRSGATYDSPSQRIIWYLQGVNRSCGISGSAGGNEGNVVTQCWITLPSL